MDHYKIGVAIMLRDGMSPVLSAISHRLLGVHKSVKDIEGGMSRWKVAIGGAVAAAGGAGLLGALVKVAKKGNEIVHQIEMMKLAGMDTAKALAATNFAYGVSQKVPQTGIPEAQKHLTELRYAFGHLDTAKKYIVPLEKANAVLNSLHKGAGDEIWPMVKSLEQKGLTPHPKKFLSYLGAMIQASEATGGRVDPRQYFRAFQYGRVAMLGWDQTFIGQYLPRLIQSMGGSTGGGGGGRAGPGNALMSAFAKVVQGQMPKKAAEEFHRMGLTTYYRRIHGSSKSNADIVGARLFTLNPYAWVQRVMMPALAKHGITGQSELIQEISRMFPVRTASQVISEMALQGSFHEGANSPFEKDARMSRIAPPINKAYSELSKHDPTAVMKAFTAQWNSMLAAIGRAASPTYLTALRDMTSFFMGVTKLAQFHPAALTAIVKGLTALGAFLVGGGAAAIVAAMGPAGWIVGGLALLGTALVMVPWKKTWDEMVRGFKFAATETPKLVTQIVSVFHRLVSAIANFAHGINIFGWHPFGAAAPPHAGGHKQGYNAVPTVGGGRMASVGHIFMDGRKVGEIVTSHQARAANGPLRGGAQYDGSATFVPADFAYARG